MKKKSASILLFCVLVFGFTSVAISANENLSRKEVEALVEEIATKRGIPSVILKSIASVESSLAQFNRMVSLKLVEVAILV